MTDDVERRKQLFDLAIENKVELHFANEFCFLKTKDDLEQINGYMNFAVAQKGKHSWQKY